MKELAKSIFRFSWAMTAFGAGQAVRMLDPERGREGVAAGLDALSHAAESELEEPVRGFYRMGERMQESLVDAADAGTRAVQPMAERAAEIFRGGRGEGG
jgi:hypothetical protein